MGCSELSLELGTEVKAVETLLGILSSPCSVMTRAHVVQVLLGMAMSADDGARVIKAQDGVSFLVESLDGNEKELRESSVRLLCFLSEPNGAAVAESFIARKKLEVLFNLLHASGTTDVRVASATIIANFPDNKGNIACLHEAGVLPPLLSVLQNDDNSMVIEKAIAALQRFTDPLQVELQRKLAEAGIHSRLISVLNSDRDQVKALAALALRNLSSSTPELSKPIFSISDPGLLPHAKFTAEFALQEAPSALLRQKQCLL